MGLWPVPCDTISISTKIDMNTFLFILSAKRTRITKKSVATQGDDLLRSPRIKFDDTFATNNDWMLNDCVRPIFYQWSHTRVTSAQHWIYWSEESEPSLSVLSTSYLSFIFSLSLPVQDAQILLANATDTDHDSDAQVKWQHDQSRMSLKQNHSEQQINKPVIYVNKLSTRFSS